ncbi:MAG TPA: asparagine--tRNA ligase [Caldisericia bacterium]|nr:asparagine--tRNA ligase [Caldisericia bacterium]HOL82509.1 asparagine--tRNA ligase [Caldisericia bacterium]HON82661.1 asparagine--tRNA ligase [Caldisericia bacterium]HPP43838.1 asparagine--tRNA ligase [Caldisericia bacterium]HRT36873.1 asparagine--tRNA ligase [Caldisericia bacterium]
MNWVYIEDLKDYVEKEVELRGWLYNSRFSGKLIFLIMRDGSGFCQCVVSLNDVGEEIFEKAKKLTLESSFIVRGVVREEKRAIGGYEILVKNIEIIQLAKDYPIGPKEHGIEFLMENRHLWIRSRKQWAIQRIRNELIKGVRDFFYERKFILFDSPILTPSACEGTTTLFDIDYFGEKAYLSQSGQLYNEIGAAAFGKVYCFGPTFRAEKSKTRRHLIEFWMVEPEVAFLDLQGNMELIEDFVSYIVQRVIENKKDELEILERDISKIKNVKPPFPKISYSDAVDLLHKKGNNLLWGEDFGGDEETLISEEYDRPVFVYKYPKECKAFYMKEDLENPLLSLSCDLLAPEGYGEIVGGGQREDSYEKLIQRMEELKIPIEPYKWYLELRKYGTFPHSGFGLGIERTLSWICGIHHVRETIPLPRLLERIYP